MSPDALTNLVHRTLTADGTVRPYRPTRYEATEIVPVTDLEEHAEVMSPPTVPPAGEPRAERSPRRAQPASDPGEQAATPSSNYATESSHGPAAEASGPDTRRPAERHPRPATEDPANPSPAPRVPSLVVGPAALRRREPSVSRLTPGPAEPGAPPRTAHLAPSRPDGRGHSPMPRAAAVTPLPTTAVTAGSSPRPEPVVQITIGRVEVRAGGPVGPPATPPTGPPNPVMALDEYLDRRRRGLS